MTPTYDVVVVGAGPYGLSTGAHLLGRGLKVAVFGRPMAMWREHMPKGMLLRSHAWATDLSDPQGAYGFDRFFRESKYQATYPVPIEAFIDYGLWFRARAVPNVDETHVSTIERHGGQFLVALEDGREVRSPAVVMAAGLQYYAHRPEQFDGVRAGLVSHTCDHCDFSRFRGQTVLVVGGGQSAIESAALLHEAGATVQVATRRPIVWLGPDRGEHPSLLARIRAPDATIAPGWQFWVWDHLPYLFYRLPQWWRDRYNNNYHSGATDWLRDRVIGKALLHEGQTVSRLATVDGKVDATLSGGATLRADHILLGTGYQVDLNRLPMIHPSLRAEILADNGIPRLDPCFQSSVPGLYFVGATSWRAFGWLYRFVAGVGHTAQRVAKAVAHAQRPSTVALSEAA